MVEARSGWVVWCFKGPGTTEIYTLPYTTVFRSSLLQLVLADVAIC